MDSVLDTLKKEERVALSLRQLYERFGYKKYKMSRFEEYGFYMDNKSFIPGGQIISFTDLDGRLLALKPDVTLSIVKNAKELKGCFDKLYYIENVYKPAKGAHKFKEISQLGLEALGPVDGYTTLEVVTLALRSLQSVEDDFVLDLSHIGIVTGLLESSELPANADKEQILQCIVSKNVHDLGRQLKACNAGEGIAAKLEKLITINGSLGSALPEICSIISGGAMEEAYEELSDIYKAIKGGEYENRVRVDFSIINDINYYCGIIFHGYVSRVPRMLLSGGRYDKLLQKFGKGVGAIGFALILDEIAAYYPEDKDLDADVLILYEKDADCKGLLEAVTRLAENGLKVRTETSLPQGLSYGRIVRYVKGKLEETDV
jgi:ATP phosphoribosyltransferase regulatory subunit